MLVLNGTLIEAIEEIQEEKISSNFYVDCSRDNFINIINKQTRTIIEAKNILNEIKEYAILFERKKEKLAKADDIIYHWKVFNDHLEKNPSIKEEWDALLMAIKLTEGE